MALRIALRSLAVQPVRSAVLACGFGAGIAAMAGLLGIGQVILEQSRSPQLAGGGDLVIFGASGDLANARHLTSVVLETPPLAGRAVAAAASIRQTLYLVESDRPPLRVFARAGIPGLERALDDYETAGHPAWHDTQRDRRWSAPDPADVLRAMDRFRAVPARGATDDSWAEWLYFNGRAAGTRFYLTFLVGPAADAGRRSAGVRLQLERGDGVETFSDRGEVDERELLARAPDLGIGGSEVRLEGLRYRIRLALWREGGKDRARATMPDLRGEVVLQASPGRSVPPFQVRGAGGWLSGYVVPVLSGPLSGSLSVDGSPVDLAGGSGYHDHNWGFWRGVTWRWGQVAGPELSFVFGRIAPPADVADPARLPGLLVALDAQGPRAFGTDVEIVEQDDPGSGVPRSIRVRARGTSLDVRLELDVHGVTRTRLGAGTFGGRDTDFLQMRADYRVTGRVSGAAVEFSAAGSAETFRGR